MNLVLIISIIVVAIILVLSVLTINKGYSHKHSVDTLADNPYESNKQKNHS